eukprot:528493_1
MAVSIIPKPFLQICCLIFILVTTFGQPGNIVDGTIQCGDTKDGTISDTGGKRAHHFIVTHSPTRTVTFSNCEEPYNDMDTRFYLWYKDSATTWTNDNNNNHCDGGSLGATATGTCDLCCQFCGNVASERWAMNLPPGEYYLELQAWLTSGPYRLMMECNPIPTTSPPTTAQPTTNIPTTSIPTTNIPTTLAPTTATPTTTIPTTAVPTGPMCDTIIFQDNLDQVPPGEWNKISGQSAILSPSSTYCANSNLCWRLDTESYYSRIISTIGYKVISLSFYFHETGVDGSEFCQIQYALNGTINTLFEQHGTVNEFGWKDVSLPSVLNNNNFTLYLKNTANGGTLGDEYCYFGNIEICGIRLPLIGNNTYPPTISPAPTNCDTIFYDPMNTVPSGWTYVSGAVSKTESTTPYCADNIRCWAMDQNGAYKRDVSAIGYKNMSLSFYFYESGLESDEFCRVQYVINSTVYNLFEVHGSVDQFGWKKIYFSPILDGTNFTLYLQNTAGGGDIGNEYCYFDNMELCGHKLLPPTTAAPSTVLPTTSVPTSASPTTDSPTTMQPTTTYPTITTEPATTNPTTAFPSRVPTRDGESPDKSTAEFEGSKDNLKSVSDGGIDNVLIIAILIVVLVMLLLCIIIVICWYRKNRNKEYNKNNNVEMMDVVKSNTAFVNSISSVSEVNSDCDVVTDMNIDIVSVEYQGTNSGSTPGNKNYKIQGTNSG